MRIYPYFKEINESESDIKYSWKLPPQVTPKEIEYYVKYAGFYDANILFDREILTPIRIISIKPLKEKTLVYNIEYYYINTVFNKEFYNKNFLETRNLTYVEGDYMEWSVMQPGFGTEGINIKGDKTLFERVRRGHCIYLHKDNQGQLNLIELDTKVPDDKLIAIVDVLSKYDGDPTVFTAANIYNEELLWNEVYRLELYHFYICLATTKDNDGEWNYDAWEINLNELESLKSGEMSIRRILDIVRKRSTPIHCRYYEEGDELYQMMDEPANIENISNQIIEGLPA